MNVIDGHTQSHLRPVTFTEERLGRRREFTDGRGTRESMKPCTARRMGDWSSAYLVCLTAWRKPAVSSDWSQHGAKGAGVRLARILRTPV